MNLGLKIRQLRKAAQLTQAELGEKAFKVTPTVGQTRINRIENGVREVTQEELNSITLALGVPISTFQGLSPYQETLEITASVQLIEEAYPEFKSLRELLSYAIQKEDAFMLHNTWTLIHDLAATQIEKYAPDKINTESKT